MMAHPTWSHLFFFQNVVLGAFAKGRRKLSHVSAVNKQIRDEAANIGPLHTMAILPSFAFNTACYLERNKFCTQEGFVGILARKVSNKFTDGNFQGEVHLECSFADFFDETYSDLQQRHPVPE